MASPGTKLPLHGAHLASCATMFAQRGAFTGSPVTKFAQHATNRRFWAIFRALGELFRAVAHHQTKQGELCTARGAGAGTKLAWRIQFGGPTGTKLSQHIGLAGPTGTKLSRHIGLAGPTGTKLSQHTRNGPIWRILRMQGEFYTVLTTKKPAGRILYRTRGGDRARRHNSTPGTAGAKRAGNT